jgi:arginine utilization protein RocB
MKIKYNNPETIKNILFRMVKYSSISGTREEVNMAREIYNVFNEMLYFKKNPQYLNLNKIEHDPLVGHLKFVYILFHP